MSFEKISKENEKTLASIHSNLGKTTNEEEMRRRKHVEYKAAAYLGSHIGQLVTFRPIFGTVFLYLNKTVSWQMPTMGVGPIRRVDLALYYNPDFVLSMNPNQLKAVLIHEALHILLHHIDRGKNYGYNPRMYNIAADMAINTHIKNLPEFACLPKQIGESDDKSSEYYYKRLKKKAADHAKSQSGKQQGQGSSCQGKEGGQGGQGEAQKEGDGQGQKQESGQGGGGKSQARHSGGHQGQNKTSGSWQVNNQNPDGQGGGGTGDLGDLIPDLKGKDLMDDHSQWGECEDDVIREKIRDIAKKAINSQEQEKGWSDIGTGLVNAILDANKPVVNWKRELRWFINKMILRGRRSTRQRPNRRFGFIQPGHKKDYTSKLLIAVDDSGSVSDREFVDFMTEINGMIDHVEVHVVFFDTTIHGNYGKSGMDVDPIPFDKKQKKVKRMYSGGTNFHIVIEYAKVRSYDGVIIMTDGFAPFPDKPKSRVLWALSDQGKDVYPPFGKRLVVEAKNA